MFTGIIEETGLVESFEGPGSSRRLVVRARLVTAGLALGESVSVDGCCLTAVECAGATAAFDVLEETRRLTHFDGLSRGSRVNLERSLRADSRMGGHFVTGHVDGTGTITVLEPRGSDHFLGVRGPPGCGRLLIHKGSIAVDGISLTLAEVEGDGFAAWIIPHTMEATTLGGRRAGDRVNLEFDLLGKYVEKMVSLRDA
jgi:riboflavin synthase